MDDIEIDVKVTNRKGVHARAAAKFVRAVEAFDARVLVAKVAGSGVVPGVEAVQVSGTSILGLMMLGAECNSVLRLRIQGPQASESADSIRKLIEGKFDEE